MPRISVRGQRRCISSAQRCVPVPPCLHPPWTHTELRFAVNTASRCSARPPQVLAGSPVVRSALRSTAFLPAARQAPPSQSCAPAFAAHPWSERNKTSAACAFLAVTAKCAELSDHGRENRKTASRPVWRPSSLPVRLESQNSWSDHTLRANQYLGCFL